MTKRDAPLIFFGSGLPAGSAVFSKSRFLLYSANPIPPKLTTNHSDSTDFKKADRSREAWISGGEIRVTFATRAPSHSLESARGERVPPTLHSAAARRQDSGRTDG